MLWSALIALAAVVMLTIVANAFALEDPWAHLSSHLAGAVPVLALVVVAWRAWPPPVADRYGRPTRAIVVVGLLVGGLAQLLEGLGAFGFDGNDRIGWLAGLHDVGLGVGVLGLLILMFGIGLAVLVGLARRMGWIESRWMPALIGIAVLGVVAFVAGSFIFGY